MTPPLAKKIEQLTPPEIVKELDKYIIGQNAAKRAVAIALRNRWRRQQVEGELKNDIYPNNIILIGSTGVGKTEIARRLANLANAPFIKVEATKYTEVGYVGRDVESMIRELMDTAVNRVKQEQMEAVRESVIPVVEERLLDLLVTPPRTRRRSSEKSDAARRSGRSGKIRNTRLRNQYREILQAGGLDDHTVEVEVSEDSMPTMQIFSAQGMEEMGINLPEMMGDSRKKRKRTMTVLEAKEFFTDEEMQRAVDMDRVIREALRRTEMAGIIFFDEIDKIAVPSQGEGDSGPDVSRSGVQRDILPVVEGTTVATKYGLIRTEHILFIAAGAFTNVKPSDLLPELQGRFPIRVELEKLGSEEFYRILTEPKQALIKQYTALLATEGVELSFTKDALKEVANIANEVNSKTEDIGARRLHTVMTTLLDEILFDAPEVKKKEIVITKEKVKKTLQDIVEDEDLSRFIL